MKPAARLQTGSASSWLRKLLAVLSAGWPFPARQCFLHSFPHSPRRRIFSRSIILLRSLGGCKYQRLRPRETGIIIIHLCLQLNRNGCPISPRVGRYMCFSMIMCHVWGSTYRLRSAKQIFLKALRLLPPRRLDLSIMGFQIAIWIKTTSIS